jgi:UPF0755 protein
MIPLLRRHRTKRQWIALAGLTSIVLILAGTYVSYRLGLRPAAASGTAQVFEIKSGERVPQIADRLKAAGLIRSRNSFISYLNFHNLRGHVNAGTYSLQPTQSGAAIAQILAHGHTLTNNLLIPEGSRLSQIRDLVVEHGISKADFDAALSAPHTQAFLATKPADVDLEGYLFPDSYEISPTTTAADLVNTMLDTFGDRVGSEYVQAFSAQGLNLHQGLTLASIVEREVNIPADRPVVAGIFLNRLKADMPLGSDVTAHYAAELQGVPFNVNIDSKYNTRRYPGLPPGPICSPGLEALDAVAHPAKTDYMYFLTGKDGKTYYAKTYAEHQQNIAQHL